MKFAKTYGVWEAFTQPQSNLPETHKEFASSLIVVNVIPTILTQIRKYDTAYQAWQEFKEQYDTFDIAQVTKYVKDLAVMNYNNFKNFDGFKQHVLNLKQLIEEYTSNTTEAFHQVIVAFVLNAIG